MSSGGEDAESDKMIAEIPINDDGTLDLSSQEAKIILENVSNANFQLDYIIGDDDADKLNDGRQGETVPAESADTLDIDVNNNQSNPDKSSNRFKDVSQEDTDAFLLENINKNTAYKTKGDLRIFTEWLQQYGEERDFHEISGSEMDSLLARFCLSVRKKDQSEYEPDTISSIFHSIERYKIIVFAMLPR